MCPRHSSTFECLKSPVEKELNILHNGICLMNSGMRREISQEPDHEDGKKPLPPRNPKC